MEHRECNSEYYLGLNDSTNEFVGEKEWFPSTRDINTHISHLKFMCIGEKMWICVQTNRRKENEDDMNTWKIL